ncbi:MAG: DUF3795 domain-containing protein [Anaerolineae bacterium]
MERIIAYCGLICSDCDAYLATQANDLEALERLARQWQEDFGLEDASVEATMCDGCLTDAGRQIGYCATCEIRACGLERGVANCAHCADYACETLEAFLAEATVARPVLDEIRASL